MENLLKFTKNINNLKGNKNMLKSFVISLAKKYVISSLNDLLEKNKSNVEKICVKISYWIEKLSLIIELLKKINERCSAGNIDNEEVDQTVNEIEKLIQEF